MTATEIELCLELDKTELIIPGVSRTEITISGVFNQTEIKPFTKVKYNQIC
jgi:hypothetical protein